MMQYLLAIHHAGARPDLPPEERRQTFADVGALVDRMKEAGAFVLAGGLLPESATVVRQSGGDERDPDALLAELQDVHGAP